MSRGARVKQQGIYAVVALRGVALSCPTTTGYGYYFGLNNPRSTNDGRSSYTPIRSSLNRSCFASKCSWDIIKSSFCSLKLIHRHCILISCGLCHSNLFFKRGIRSSSLIFKSDSCHNSFIFRNSPCCINLSIFILKIFYNSFGRVSPFT